MSEIRLDCWFPKGVTWGPQTVNAKNMQEYNRDVRTLVGIFLLYFYSILGVPCLGSLDCGECAYAGFGKAGSCKQVP